MSDIPKEEGLEASESKDNFDLLDDDDIDEEFEMEGDEEMLMQKLQEIGDSGRSKHKTFEGIPKQWH